MAQLPLPFPLEPSARFETFVAGTNEVLLDHLRSIVNDARPEPTGLWMWGVCCGKSHLLQASCAAAPAGSAIYLPLRDLAESEPVILRGLESLDLVALDDVDAVAGEPAWDRELFSLFNGTVANGGRLFFTAGIAPAGLEFSLPDLASRMAGTVVYQVRQLEDEDRIAALQTHALFRGLDLPESSARFLLNRVPRDMGGLCRWLDALDHASLAAQRRLTIPFIRETLAAQA